MGLYPFYGVYDVNPLSRSHVCQKTSSGDITDGINPIDTGLEIIGCFDKSAFRELQGCFAFRDNCLARIAINDQVAFYFLTTNSQSSIRIFLRIGIRDQFNVIGCQFLRDVLDKKGIQSVQKVTAVGNQRNVFMDKPEKLGHLDRGNVVTGNDNVLRKSLPFKQVFHLHDRSIGECIAHRFRL
ncbi:hypothetical protein SDC9_94474 [bioreactor metagenome]|uniref:Uncharacterized protein n=1 Tax=bioreactor metagenome TaxID=1076179 RepID=A0A645A4Z3_9ZZZZ